MLTLDFSESKHSIGSGELLHVTQTKVSFHMLETFCLSLTQHTMNLQ